MSPALPDIEATRNNATRNLIGLLALILTLAIAISKVFSTSIDRVDTKVDVVRQELVQHKDNSSIHRTAEEAATKDQAEESRWQQLFRELDQLNKRMDNLERRTR